MKMQRGKGSHKHPTL